MGAKQKLNSAHVGGILLIAGVMGGLTGSWVVFTITRTALFLASIHAGDIRE